MNRIRNEAFRVAKSIPMLLLGGIAWLMGSLVMPVQRAEAAACSRSAGIVSGSNAGNQADTIRPAALPRMHGCASAVLRH